MHTDKAAAESTRSSMLGAVYLSCQLLNGAAIFCDQLVIVTPDLLDSTELVAGRKSAPEERFNL